MVRVAVIRGTAWVTLLPQGNGVWKLLTASTESLNLKTFRNEIFPDICGPVLCQELSHVEKNINKEFFSIFWLYVKTKQNYENLKYENIHHGTIAQYKFIKLLGISRCSFWNIKPSLLFPSIHILSKFLLITSHRARLLGESKRGGARERGLNMVNVGQISTRSFREIS